MKDAKNGIAELKDRGGKVEYNGVVNAIAGGRRLEAAEKNDGVVDAVEAV